MNDSKVNCIPSEVLDLDTPVNLIKLDRYVFCYALNVESMHISFHMDIKDTDETEKMHRLI